MQRLKTRWLRIKPRLREEAGQALVELLVAMGIAGLMLPALGTAIVATRGGRAQQEQRLAANGLLREANEAVRIVRQTSWAGISTNGTYYPAISGSTWGLTAGTETVGTAPGQFTRSIVISDAQRNSSGTLVASGGTVDPSTKKIVTTVSWSAPISDSISTETYYQRYLNNNTWVQTTNGGTEFGGGTNSNTSVTATGGGQVELAAVAGSPIVYAQSASSTADASATTIAQAFSANVTGGSLIVAAISWQPGGATVTCSDSQNNTYTTVTSTNDASFNQSLAVCYAPNAIGGPTTVTATFASTSQFRRIAVSEYKGVATTSPVDVTKTNTATGTTATDNLTSTAATTTTNGDLIFGAVMDDDNSPYGTISAGTGFTQRTIVASQLAIQDRVQTTAGSIASTQTSTVAHRYLAHMVSFKAAGTATAWNPPVGAGSYDNSGTTDALDVVVSGTYVYLAVGTTLRIIDVSNPASPSLTGTYTAGGTINALAISGNYVYLATSNTAGEFVVVNVTTKSSPTATVVNLANTNIGTAIAVANSRAYIGRALSGTAGQNEFFIYNVTTPTSPVAEGSLDLTAQVNAIVVPTATHAYLATSITTAEISVVKIDVPASPTAAGTYDASGTSIANDIYAVGTTLYMAKANNASGAELFILTPNTTTPTAVTFALNGSYEAGANINGVVVSGSNAYLATAITSAQFRVLNISAPASITVVGSLNLNLAASKIDFDGTYAHVASTHDLRELTVLRSTPVASGSGSGYQASGTFTSTTFDAGAGNVYAYNYINFTATEPASTDLRFQLASNNDNSTWNYIGPDGTASTYYSAAGPILITTTGRYLRYRATLTGPTTSTPVLSDITINYSP